MTAVDVRIEGLTSEARGAVAAAASKLRGGISFVFPSDDLRLLRPVSVGDFCFFCSSIFWSVILDEKEEFIGR